MRDLKISAVFAKTVGRLFAICLLSISLSAPSFAATVTYELDHHFGEVAAGTVTVVILDVTSTYVRLDVTANDMGEADVTALYLNIGNGIDPTELQFGYLGSSAPAATSIIHDPLAGPSGDYKADGDGYYDIVMRWDNDTFNDGETSSYFISLDFVSPVRADDFNFLSEPGGGAGTFYAAAKVQSTGIDQKGSDWVGAPVPIPAAVWLFGSGLGLLGWMRRRQTA